MCNQWFVWQRGAFDAWVSDIERGNVGGANVALPPAIGQKREAPTLAVASSGRLPRLAVGGQGTRLADVRLWITTDIRRRIVRTPGSG